MPLNVSLDKLSNTDNVLERSETRVRGSYRTRHWKPDMMKVLIVEDSEPVRRMIKSFVEDLVHEFAECKDGSEALSAYRLHRPDVVLMDIEMGGMDGLTATREIKSAFPEARIVIVSQWANAKLKERAESSGAEGYVMKSDLVPLRQFLGEPA